MAWGGEERGGGRGLEGRGRCAGSCVCARTRLTHALCLVGARALFCLWSALLPVEPSPHSVLPPTPASPQPSLAKRQQKWSDAETAYAEALRIFRTRPGEGQAETADTLYQVRAAGRA